MTFEIFSTSLKAAAPAGVAIMSLALTLGAGTALAQSATTSSDSTDREEIIVTHKRMGPLSEWAAMQQHSADYKRLKEKYDPTQGSSHTDSWASDRNLASHSNNSDSFMQESADSPTPPAVQAVKDAIVPP